MIATDCNPLTKIKIFESISIERERDHTHTVKGKLSLEEEYQLVNVEGIKEWQITLLQSSW